MAEQPSTRGEGRDGTGARGVIADRAATARHVEQPPVDARPVRALRAALGEGLGGLGARAQEVRA